MNVYVTRKIPEKGIEMLREKFDVEVNEEDHVLSKAELMEKVKGRDAVLCLLTDGIDGEVMDAAGSQCKVFSNYAVGYNNIDVDAASARGVMVTNTPDVLTDTTADMAVALLFAVARRVVEGDSFMRAEKFEQWEPMLLLGKEVTGQTLGIIGAGRIGANIAGKMNKGFSMKIIYSDPEDNEELDALGARRVEIEELCRESDFISIHCNMCEATRHLINAERISMMKQGAILINTARGPIVEEEALIKALQEGRIFGAGLDVYEDEPKMKIGLKDLPNVVLAPHVGSATIETRTKMAVMAAQNIIDALEGRKPAHLVNDNN